MSTNIPPNPNVSIFNNAYFTSVNESLTVEEANLKYVKFPVAQGNNTLKNLTIQGNANVTSGVNSLILNSNCTALQYTASIQEGDQALIATGTNNNALVLSTQSSINTRIRIENNNLTVVANNFLRLDGASEISMTTVNLNLNGQINSRGIFNSMNIVNDNRLLFNTNPSIGLYNPCVTSTSMQVISATTGSGTNNDTLVLTTSSSTSNGIIIGSNTVNFPSTNAPTSNQILLSSDNSNKIPTSSWVKNLLTTFVYSVRYTTNQTVITPNNCRSIDVTVMGAGGKCGSSVVVSGTVYNGGSGSGANTIVGYGLPMGPNELLVLTFSLTSNTGSTTITLNNNILCRGFNGNKGNNAVLGVNVDGASVNSTIGIGDTSFCSWYNSFGTAGAASYLNGFFPPTMNMNGCPKGNTNWVLSSNGMAQRDISSLQGIGYVLITYHIA
jgi:hypothetical protein